MTTVAVIAINTLDNISIYIEYSVMMQGYKTLNYYFKTEISTRNYPIKYPAMATNVHMDIYKTN